MVHCNELGVQVACAGWPPAVAYSAGSSWVERQASSPIGQCPGFSTSQLNTDGSSGAGDVS